MAAIAVVLMVMIGMRNAAEGKLWDCREIIVIIFRFCFMLK